MNGISCFVNFKEDLNKNLPYYDLLIRQINGSGNDTNPWCGEHAILCAGSMSRIVSKICEGYQFTIVFSGYIHFSTTLKSQLSRFGYHFLTEDDAEIVLTSYIHYGEECIKHLSGEFSFIVYDSMRRQIFAVSDPIASSTIFFSNVDDFWILSSSISGIFAHPKIPKKISGTSILEFICAQNRVPENIFENVHILRPGQILKITAGKIEKKLLKDFSSPANEQPLHHEKSSSGIIFTDDLHSHKLLERLGKTQLKNHCRINVYAKKMPETTRNLPIIFHRIPIDHSSILEGITASVEALGVPFLTPYDHLLTRTIKPASTDDCELFFATPDRYPSRKCYLKNLVQNNAFTFGIKNNIDGFSPSSDIFLPYPKLIGNYYDRVIKTPHISANTCEFSVPEDNCTKKILRHILLDIISKDYPPITAFFRREALLKLCEGGFVFSQEHSESELIAYLIKLNIWFEKFKPQII